MPTVRVKGPIPVSLGFVGTKRLPMEANFIFPIYG
jgi:hypothetical protein